MNGLLFDEKQRYKVIQEVAAIKEISNVIVEKDFWVTWVLGALASWLPSDIYN
mgnify:FL=1